ncbi:MAG: hypothetical protein LV479_05895 [Methylacidiphilales bacterium]|nr:hypothetical protein [Candidatus Methylacidiphilales bacterium]
MNTLKKLVLSAGLLAVACAGSAQAQISGTPTYVRITGSTAYRAAVHEALLNLLTGISGTGNPQVAYNGSNLAGANQAIFYGEYTPSGGSAIPLVVKTSWNGSVGGIKCLTQNVVLSQTVSSTAVSLWLADGNITAGTDTAQPGPQSVDPNTFPGGGAGILNYKPCTQSNGSGGTIATTHAGSAISGASTTIGDWEPLNNQVADVGFSDAFQNTTLYPSTNIGATAETTTGAGAIVGLVDFIWIKNAATTGDQDYAAWQRLTNVTPNLLKQLYTIGHAPISLFTGNSADYPGATVYAIGRDEDSGTRINAYAEDYFGVNGSPKQYYLSALGTSPSTLGGSVTSGSLSLFPAQTVEGTSEPIGHSGFSSGGKVGAEMSTVGTDGVGISTRAYFVTYIGLDDATSFLNATSSVTGYVNGARLTWNGVDFDANGPQKIEQGEYSFWSYEHMYYRTGSITAGGQTVGALSSVNPNAQTLADALATDLNTTDELVASGVPLSAMQVSRTVEGGPITHN